MRPRRLLGRGWPELGAARGMLRRQQERYLAGDRATLFPTLPRDRRDDLDRPRLAVQHVRARAARHDALADGRRRHEALRECVDEVQHLFGVCVRVGRGEARMKSDRIERVPKGVRHPWAIKRNAETRRSDLPRPLQPRPVAVGRVGGEPRMKSERIERERVPKGVWHRWANKRNPLKLS